MTFCYQITRTARQYKQERERDSMYDSEKDADLFLLQVQTDHASKSQAI
jgi:hypothetical protein